MHAFEKFLAYLWDGRERVEVTGYADDLFTERALEYLTDEDPAPFFLYLAYTAPHFNVEAPADEVARHRGDLAETEIDRDQPINATYAAMVTRLDRHVGQILDALDASGRADDTLIVFTSDHGATFEGGNRGASRSLDSNRPFRGQKRTLWEGGLRAPAVVAWPGHVPAGGRSAETASLLDLLPTFAAAAGAPVDDLDLDGVDQGPAWTGGAKTAPRLLTWQWRAEGSDQLAAVWGRHKLVVQGTSRPELFDVIDDPAERLDRSAEFPELVDRLAQSLEARYPREDAEASLAP